MKKTLSFVLSVACWALVPALGLVHPAWAQTNKQPAQSQTPPAGKTQQVRVKMIRTENGKTQVLDTTLTVGEPAGRTDMLQQLREMDLAPGKGPGSRMRLLSPADTLFRHMPGLIRLPGQPPGQIDSIKIIYFKKGLPADTALVKDVHALTRLVPAGLPDDSLPGIRRFQLHREMIVLDSLSGVVALPGQEGKGLPIIVEAEEILPAIDGKKADVLVPAFPESRIIIINGEEAISTKEPAAGKTSKSRKAAPPGLREDLKVRSFKVYPNPSKGRFTISLEPARAGNLSIQVLDGSGEVFHEESFQNFKGHLHKEIDISGSRSGIYYLRIVQGNSYLTRKVVLK